DGTGQLRPRGTYQLRSNDYYSSRNYASRLIGTKLVYYTPLFLPYGLDEPLAALPSMRRWKPQTEEEGGRFERIATPQRVYRPAQWEPGDDIALHTVTECDLAAPEISCEATVVIGPSGRVFYVSSGAVYVWMSEWSRPDRRSAPRAILCRMPLDGSSPSALGVSGSPVDQFSFLESDDGYVNVLVRSDAWGDWMWSPEWAGRAGGAVDAALLRVPVQSFGDGRGVAPRSSYRRLPTDTISISVGSGSMVGPAWRNATPCPMPRRASCGVTGSSIEATRRMRACWVCRSAGPGDRAGATSSKGQPRSCSSAIGTGASRRSAPWRETGRARKTTPARPRASIGMETRGRSSLGTASSRSWATSWWRAGSRRGGSTTRGGSASLLGWR